MKEYTVTIPFAGHVHITVEADSEEKARELAVNQDWFLDLTVNSPSEEISIELGEYEQLEMFNQGNVCYCPSPWEIDVEEV